MKDTHTRSIAKAISWRVVATVTTMVLVLIFTGNFALTLGIGVFDLLSKLVFYYGHERVWNAITWGKTQ